MTTEKKVKDLIKEKFKGYGSDLWYYMIVPMGYGRRGVPDFIGCYLGHFYGVEAKREGKDPTPWQDREMEAIRAAGGKIFRFSSTYTYEQFSYDFEIWAMKVRTRNAL